MNIIDRIENKNIPIIPKLAVLFLPWTSELFPPKMLPIPHKRNLNDWYHRNFTPVRSISGLSMEFNMPGK